MGRRLGFCGGAQTAAYVWGFRYPKPPGKGLLCGWEWPNTAIPTGGPGPDPFGKGYTAGTEAVIAYGVPPAGFAYFKKNAETGYAPPVSMPSATVRSVNLGRHVRAIVVSGYSGAGATTNTIAGAALSAHDNFVSMVSWNASQTQIVRLVKQVRSYRHGRFRF